MSNNLNKKYSKRIRLVGFLSLNIFLVSISVAQTDINTFIQERIDRDGKIDGGKGNFFKHLVSRKYGRLTNKKLWRARDYEAPCSTIDQVVGQPEYFGTIFNWCKDDEDILVIVYINAADKLGICITGVERNNRISIVRASKLSVASFSEKDEPPFKGNPFLPGLIGFSNFMDGTRRVALNSLPIGFMDAADKYAKSKFNPENVKTKRRNIFGIDPRTEHHARQEGGVVIAMPEQDSPVYSGDDNHKDRWLQGNYLRLDSNRPSHILNSHFLSKPNMSWVTRQAGELYILVWDHKFDDNAGYYRLTVRLQHNPNLYTD